MSNDCLAIFPLSDSQTQMIWKADDVSENLAGEIDLAISFYLLGFQVGYDANPSCEFENPIFSSAKPKRALLLTF